MEKPRNPLPLNMESSCLGNTEQVSRSWCSDGALTRPEVHRYNRAILLPEVGPVAYENMLRKVSVVVVGAGGLGSSCCLYLAGGGLRTLGIVDSDVVEISNLHRQIIHTTDRAGMQKAESAAIACRALNPSLDVAVHNETRMSHENVLSIVSRYDIVVDATDNITSRYVLSDACVRLGKPLVSGAAVGWDGQVTVLNYGPEGPCYRCLHPIPPPTSTMQSCSDAGVMGAVPGAIGALLALEVQKIALRTGEPLSGRMLHYDGQRARSFVMRLRPRDRKGCEMCRALRHAEQPDAHYVLPQERNHSVAAAAGALPFPKTASERECTISMCPDLPEANQLAITHLSPDLLRGSIVLDVRPSVQFALCRLPEMSCRALLNIPHDEFITGSTTSSPNIAMGLERLCTSLRAFHFTHGKSICPMDESVTLLVMCRRGVKSSYVVKALLDQESYLQDALTRDRSTIRKLQMYSVMGGLNAYAATWDSEFPIY